MRNYRTAAKICLAQELPIPLALSPAWLQCEFMDNNLPSGNTPPPPTPAAPAPDPTPPAPPPAAASVVNATRTEREANLEAELREEREQKRQREVRYAELEDENRQLKSALQPAAPKKKVGAGWFEYED